MSIYIILLGMLAYFQDCTSVREQDFEQAMAERAKSRGVLGSLMDKAAQRGQTQCMCIGVSGTPSIFRGGGFR